MAFGFVQYKQVDVGTPVSSLTSPSMTIGAGHLVTVAVQMGYGGATHSATSVTDSLGNSYTKAISVNNPALFGGVDWDFWYCQNVLGGTGTITANFSPNPSFSDLLILEYSGMSLSGGPSSTASQAPGSGTPSLAITTVDNDDLIIGYGISSATGVTASTLTDRTGSFISGQGVAGDQEQTPAGTPTVTFNAPSAAHTFLLASFQIAGATPVTSKPVLCIIQ